MNLLTGKNLMLSILFWIAVSTDVKAELFANFKQTQQDSSTPASPRQKDYKAKNGSSVVQETPGIKSNIVKVAVGDERSDVMNQIIVDDLQIGATQRDNARKQLLEAFKITIKPGAEGNFYVKISGRIITGHFITEGKTKPIGVARI